MRNIFSLLLLAVAMLNFNIPALSKDSEKESGEIRIVIMDKGAPKPGHTHRSPSIIPFDASYDPILNQVVVSYKAYTVKNVGIGNHSLAYYLQTVTWANVENSCTASNVDAIRYIDFAGKQAITFFPNQIVKKTDNKIELNFRVPFGGVSQGPGYINGEFHVIHQ